MKVRVYDSLHDTYFKSEVYAIINSGWYEKRLVLVPDQNGAYMKFFDFLDKKENGSHDVLINTIVSCSPSEWISRRSCSVDIQLEDYNGILDKKLRFFEYIGYSWIFENKSILAELLVGNTVPVKNSIFENKVISSVTVGWNYIETPEDVENLMDQASDFHDTVLKELNYVSGAYTTSDGIMFPEGDLRKITMYIDSQWCHPIEMIFEGVTALNLRPAGDNYGEDIFEASLFVKDASVFFCDGSLKEIDTSYAGTWIAAYSLRWRFLS